MDDWADDIQDFEYPEPDDGIDGWDDGDDITETILCPECRDTIYSESVYCPSCGFLLTENSRRAQGRPKWWTWLIAIIILSFVLTFLLS